MSFIQRLLPAFVIGFLLAGCSGDEAPKEGDNPVAANAATTPNSPAAAKRPPFGGIGARSGAGGTPAARKGQ